MLNYREYQNYKIFLERQFMENNKVLHESLSQEEKEERDELIKNVKEDVERCTAIIMGKYKFFGEFVFKMRYIYTYRVPTMATDGINIFINPLFVAKELKSDNNIIFVLCHEILHNVMIHFVRQKAHGANDHGRWNEAADYEINPILVDEKLLTASEVKDRLKGLYSEEYLDMPAEEIYDRLASKKDEDKSDTWFPAEIGDIVRTKDGKYGRIDGIDASGDYEITEITREEAVKALNK